MAQHAASGPRSIAVVDMPGSPDASLAVVLANRDGVLFATRETNASVPWSNVRGVRKRLVGNRAIEVIELERGDGGDLSHVLIRPFGKFGMFPAKSEDLDRLLRDLRSLYVAETGERN